MVRYGIIGCGMMGREHIRNINLLEKAKVTAIVEPNCKMIELVKPLVPEAKLFNKTKDFLRYAEIDCVVIATPNFCHLNDLVEIGSKISKPLLIEKPVVTRLVDVQKLLQFAKEYRSPIWVAMEYRYMPILQEFLAKVKPVTGKVEMLSIREHRYPFLKKVDNWNRFNKLTGGTFVEKCCHFFDLMRLITSSEPVQVMASGGQACNHLAETYKGKKADIWDSGYVLVDFENGTRSMLELCMFADTSKYQEEISAIGKLGKIEAKIIGPKRFWHKNLGNQPRSKLVINKRFKKMILEKEIEVDPELLGAGDHNGSTYYQHKKFYKVVTEGKEIEVDLHDGLSAVKMGLAAQLSSIERRTVKMSEFNAL